MRELELHCAQRHPPERGYLKPQRHDESGSASSTAAAMIRTIFVPRGKRQLVRHLVIWMCVEPYFWVSGSMKASGSLGSRRVKRRNATRIPTRKKHAKATVTHGGSSCSRISKNVV